MEAAAAAAAHSVTVAFDTTGSAIGGLLYRPILDSCMMSRKYVINSPSSANFQFHLYILRVAFIRSPDIYTSAGIFYHGFFILLLTL